MDIRNCKSCGALFNYTGRNICPACVKKLEAKFEQVKKYIRENRLNRWRKHINSYNSRRKWTISNIRKEIPSWKYSSYKIRSCIKWSKTNSNK